MIDDIVEQIEIKASPDVVFTAWTTPEQLLTWWGETDSCRCTDWQIDLRPGGKWHVRGIGKDSNEFAIEGEYVRVDRPSFLSFTWQQSREEINDKTLVEIELKPTKNGTLLKLKHSGFVRQKTREDHQGGWPRVLAWHRAFAEKLGAVQVKG